MNGFKDKKDGALVELSLLGNEKAYEELVIRYEKSVKGTALKVTENEFSAEDASQDAFVSAWIKLDSLREPDKFGSWVCSIAKNCARSLKDFRSCFGGMVRIAIITCVIAKYHRIFYSRAITINSVRSKSVWRLVSLSRIWRINWRNFANMSF